MNRQLKFTWNCYKNTSNSFAGGKRLFLTVFSHIERCHDKRSSKAPIKPTLSMQIDLVKYLHFLYALFLRPITFQDFSLFFFLENG